MGYQAVAITDHADSSNLEFILPKLIQVAADLNRVNLTKLIPGVELTHIPPQLIDFLVKRARELGAKLVIVHGETIVEPVAPGTNQAALEAGVDILAHPGLITYEDAKLAAEKGILLELSARKGHSLTNGHVAKMAIASGAKLILDSDSHAPEDFMSEALARKVVQGAGLEPDSFPRLLNNARQLLHAIGYPL
jgi:histidinol phosphatase-like PHP family hydrolase